MTQMGALADTVHAFGRDLGLTAEQITALATVCLVVVTLATNVFLVLVARRQANAAKTAAVASVKQALQLEMQREDLADAAFPEIEADAGIRQVIKRLPSDIPAAAQTYGSTARIISVRYVNGAAMATAVVAFARVVERSYDDEPLPKTISFDFGTLSPTKSSDEADPGDGPERLQDMPFAGLVGDHQRDYAGVRWLGPGGKGRWWLRVRNEDGSDSIHRGVWRPSPEQLG